MENKNINFPIPNPDRRSKVSNASTSSNKGESSNSNTMPEKNPFIPAPSNISNFQNKFNSRIHNSYNPYSAADNPDNNPLAKSEVQPDRTTTSMLLIKQKHIQDMRSKIENYKLLTDKAMFLPTPTGDYTIHKCSIILFGPSGSGKSSFIKSLYRALYNTNRLPPEVTSKLIIKSEFQNEGTLCFTRLFLKEETPTSSGIILCDTRGQIKMNDLEKEQFKILIEGKVKDNVQVEQRAERNPLALWEFWKKDSELFPKEILCAQEVGLESIPHCVVLVFDGSKEEIIEKEDECFYKELVNISRRKNYTNIHVILTRIDLFEKIFLQQNNKMPVTEGNNKMNTIKDEKIERVIDILGVSRSNIHFIENYHGDDQTENSLELDYHLLKTLCDLVNSCETFIMNYLNRTETCFASCFPRK